MHRPGRSALPMAVLLVLASGCTPAAGLRPGPHRADTVTISVVGTADLHGAVVGTDTRGGLPLLGGYVRNLRAARATDAGAVLLVDAGDMFQGTLESNINEGAAVIAAYNALGYHAAAIGNHEFDFGPEGERVSPGSAADDPQGALKARAAEARFPLLAANVVDRSTGAPVRWRNVAPSTLLEIAGVRVGLVGVTTESTPDTTLAANLMGLTIAPLAQTIVREAEQLRARGAAVVVVAAHAGGRCRQWRDPDDLSSCDPDGEIFRAARSLPPGLVDVIVGGHTHVRLAHRVAGTTVIQAGVRGAAFARADIRIERRTRAVSSVRVFPPQEVCGRVDRTTGTCEGESRDAVLVDAVYEGRPVVPDDAVASALEPAIRRVAALKNTSLGVVVDESLPREPLAESALGNLLTDAVRMSVPNTDVVLLNGGGIRTPLPAGELTYGRLFEVFPFDNRLVTLTMRGEQLRRIVAHNLQATNPVTEIIAIAGVRVGAACEGDTLYVRLSRPSGAPITDAEQVRVTTVDFVASGGDGLLAPAGALQSMEPADANSPLLRDVVAEWLRTRGGHLAASEFIRDRRWQFPGTRPVRCAAADR